jgi:predicted TIM-barrel enzyme
MMSTGILKLIDGVLRDVERLQAGGVDAIMFGNENDRPTFSRPCLRESPP